MPALSFQKQFIPRIESGEKTHTIRAKRKRAWKVGDDLALFTAMRTKQCRRLFNAPCVRVQDITITVYYSWMSIVIEGQQLGLDEADIFARLDGFGNLHDMWKFWAKRHGLGTFRGDLIHWDYARRQYPAKAAA